jgi:hypothetical protein
MFFIVQTLFYNAREEVVKDWPVKPRSEFYKAGLYLGLSLCDGFCYGEKHFRPTEQDCDPATK